MRLSDGEIAELNDAVRRGRMWSVDLRAGFAVHLTALRTGEFIAESVARHDRAADPRRGSSARPGPATRAGAGG
jgi:hypothetical protein